MLEVGAGVLHVGVKEEAVQAAIEIVVVRSIAPRAPYCVALMLRAQCNTKPVVRPRDPRRRSATEIAAEEHEQIADRPLRNDDPAIHVKLAKRKLWSEDELPRRSRVRQAHGDALSRAIADDESRP
ncbi:MAG TPA: hypothetical protein VGA46_09335 [Methyloceanibacter sp.]